MLEKDLENKCCEWVRRRGGKHPKFKSPQNRGVHDRIFILPGGLVVFGEFKRSGQKPTKLQWKKIRDYRDLGCHSTWFDDYDEFVSYMKGLMADV